MKCVYVCVAQVFCINSWKDTQAHLQQGLGM